MNLYIMLPFLSLAFLLTLYQLFRIIFYRKTLIKKLKGKAVKLDKALVTKMMIKKKPVLQQKGFRGKIERILAEAAVGEAKNTDSFLKNAGLLCMVIVLATLILTESLLFAAVALLLTPAGIYHALLYMKRRRIKAFLNQLPDVLNFLSSSLKSGYSLMQAMNTVAEEGTPPASIEFKRVLGEINLGKSYENAFDKMVLRNPAEEIEILTTAILITRETGANLAFILDSVSDTFRERDKISGEVRSLTAQGRLSGIILSLLPLAILIMIYLLNPAYIQPLFSQPAGRLLLFGGICSQALGVLLIKKIVRLDW